MEPEKLEELMTKVNNTEVLLLIELENAYDLYDFIIDYELYGDYTGKMFELCNEDIEYMQKTYNFIKHRAHITKEIVHTNLDFDEPIPFINPMYASIGIEAMMFAMSSLSFGEEFNEKLIQSKKGPSV